MEHPEILGLSPEEKKAWFKKATITHRLLEQTDRVIMRAIQEHGGFAYVLVYGPSGVGKTTMIRQVSHRLNGTVPSSRPSHMMLDIYGQYPLQQNGVELFLDLALEAISFVAIVRFSCKRYCTSM